MIRGRRSSPTACSTVRPVLCVSTRPNTAATWPAIRAPAWPWWPRRRRRIRWRVDGHPWPAWPNVPSAPKLDAAREGSHLAAVAAAKYYIDYSDFSVWVLRVHRVGGSAATAGWIRRPAPITLPPSRIRSGRWRPGRSPTSMPTTPSRWRRWPGVGRLPGCGRCGVHEHRPLRAGSAGGHSAWRRLHPGRLRRRTDLGGRTALGGSRSRRPDPRRLISRPVRTRRCRGPLPARWASGGTTLHRRPG